MYTLLEEHAVLIRRLRRSHSNVTVEEIEQFLNQLLLLLKRISYKPEKTDGLNLLTTICDDLSSMKTLELFNHPVLINHPIFVYVRQTFQLLLTKSNHARSIPMQKHEEAAFYSISYLITQLCLHRNEYIDCFYGRIAGETTPVTEKPNPREKEMKRANWKPDEVTEKPNVKIACLHPSAPKARPIDKSKLDIEKVSRRKQYPDRQTQVSLPSTMPKCSYITRSAARDLPIKAYRDLFLNDMFFGKLQRALGELSQHEYSPYDVKYKVTDRLVYLCSKIDATALLCEPIVKCLCSNLYYQTLLTIKEEQPRLTPKQLFFLCRCPKVIIQHNHPDQEKALRILCPVMIERTEAIIDFALSKSGKSFDYNWSSISYTTSLI